MQRKLLFVAAIFIAPWVLLAPFLRVEVVQAQQAPLTVATLSYPAVPRVQSTHYYVPHCFTAAMQMHEFRRSGRDVPLSAHYMIITAANLSKRDDITLLHGWSSAILGMELARTNGAPPAAMCPSLATRVTPAMEAEALKYCVGQEFKTFADVPNYPAALAYLSAHPGAAVVLTTAGRKGYAILGVEPDGRGLWFDSNHVGRPTVGPKTEKDGTVLWNAMLYADDELGPENFVVVVTIR